MALTHWKISCKLFKFFGCKQQEVGTLYVKQQHIFVHKNAWIMLTNLAFAVIMLAGCDLMGSSTPPPTPTPPPLQQMTTLNLGLPQKALNAPIVGAVPDDQMLHVNITLKVDQATLDQLGSSSSTVPQSGNGTTTTDLSKKLGISDDKLKQIQSYFGVEHIDIKPNKTRTNLSFDAKAGSVARLLGTKFVIHKLDNRQFFTPDPKQMPRIPTSIAGYILAITGLDNYSLPPKLKNPLADQALSNRSVHTGSNASCINWNLYPTAASTARVAHAYGYDRLWNAGWHGENMTINFVEMDGFDANDLNNYFACTGSRASLKYVNMGATAPAPGGEATLDIEMVAGLAPAAQMMDYQMDPAKINGAGADWWTAFNDALQQIVADNQGIPHPGSILSISLGGPEDAQSQDVLLAIDQSLKILTQAEHMTIFVASGDCGAFDEETYGGPIGADFPASDPTVTAVGGTRITAPNGVRTSEVVWSDRSNLSVCHNTWGSGGGLSNFFDKATLQDGAGVTNQYSTGKRQVPDISAVAINIPVYFQGQWTASGGTSAATPIWAAGLALVNQGLMTKKQVYYYGPVIFYYAANHAANLRPYYDVTVGDNLYYKAGPGWDYASGLGTPNLADFFTILYNAQ